MRFVFILTILLLLSGCLCGCGKTFTPYEKQKVVEEHFESPIEIEVLYGNTFIIRTCDDEVFLVETGESKTDSLQPFVVINLMRKLF